jgi:cytochrome c-type biogenesis protein CcmH/NrfF
MSPGGTFVAPCGTKWPAGWIAATLLAVVLLPATALATPQTSINDIEDEVMCPICGTLLELAESPQAQRERVLVKRLIAEGKSKAEIKDALVAEYGREVLALPGGSGFDLTAYLVPAIAFVAAVIGLGLGVKRWRRAGRSPGSEISPSADGPPSDDAERLEADLARYDL